MFTPPPKKKNIRRGLHYCSYNLQISRLDLVIEVLIWEFSFLRVWISQDPLLLFFNMYFQDFQILFLNQELCFIVPRDLWFFKCFLEFIKNYFLLDCLLILAILWPPPPPPPPKKKSIFFFLYFQSSNFILKQLKVSLNEFANTACKAWFIKRVDQSLVRCSMYWSPMK